MENLRNKSGIYRWRNLINHKGYYGSAVDLYNRRAGHLHYLRNNIHHSKYFQNAWNKYGEEGFIFEILELIIRLENESFKQRLCFEREQFYLDQYGAQEYIKKESNRFAELTYNISPTAGGGSLGRVLAKDYKPWNKGLTNHLSEETLSRMSDKRKKRITKQSTKDKMSKSIKLKRSTEEGNKNYKAALSKRPLLICPHCSYQSYNKGSITRSHFDNCKLNPNFDYKAEEKRKEEISKKLKAAKVHRVIVICPHCDKQSQNKGWMVRFHFDNCKSLVK